MSLGFDLPAGSVEEAKTNLEGCSELIKMVYPVYNNKNILVKPPLVRIQFANLIKSDIGIDHDEDGETYTSSTGSDGVSEVVVTANKKATPEVFGLLGWISGLSWKPNLEMGMFTTGEELYPKVVSLSFSFNVLHEKTPSQKSTGMFPFGG